jgi:hypothetical protein
MKFILDGWDQFPWDLNILETDERVPLGKYRPDFISEATIPVAMGTCIPGDNSRIGKSMLF